MVAHEDTHMNNHSLFAQLLLVLWSEKQRKTLRSVIKAVKEYSQSSFSTTKKRVDLNVEQA